MGAKKQKAVKRSRSVVQPPPQTRAKGIIIRPSLDGSSSWEALVLEKARDGTPDFVGGRGKAGEKPRKTLGREFSQELPGVILRQAVHIYEHREIKKSGIVVVRHFFVVDAELPDHPKDIQLSDEHTNNCSWVPEVELPMIGLEEFYLTAVQVGKRKINSMVQNQAANRIQIPIAA